MNSFEKKSLILENMIELIELPDTAYQKAKDRYDDIGKYLGREESSCHACSPHVFPQGSFRLGTAIRPLDNSEEYDLDLACNLSEGISTQSHTQEQLKSLIGGEIESYRRARNIKSSVKEKHRCWRLEYEDHLSFHMDIVPCIPEDKARKKMIMDSMVNYGIDYDLSEDLSRYAVAITDDRHPEYNKISDDWNISNPEGYARWFVSKMNLGKKLLLDKAQVDDIPIYKRKTPLQRVIQILKRHRDQMFSNQPDGKPISIIISTLAANSYHGQTTLEDALSAILGGLKEFSNSGSSTVKNPVNPDENFADRWTMEQYKHLHLRENFTAWVTQALADFKSMLSSTDAGFIAEQAGKKLSVNPSPKELGEILGISVAPSIQTMKKHDVETSNAKPWLLEN